MNKTTFVYDAASRVVQEIDPLGKSATLAFDAVGRMSSATDRLGRRRDFAYDALNRQIGETWVASNGSTVDNRLTFTFDSVGNLLTAADFDGAYTLTYDALNRATTVHDPWGKRLTFTWDAVGNRTQVQDSEGGTTASTFDSLNRLTERLTTGVGSTHYQVVLTYNARGEVTEQYRKTGTGAPYSLSARTSLAYDAAGRVTNLQHRDALSANIANYTYVYDAGSRLSTETRNGTTTTYTHDNADQLTADGTNSVTYDLNGNRNNGSYATTTGNRMTTDGTWNYTHDDEGNQTKKVRISDGLTWTYGYDQRNQLLWAERRTTDGGTLQAKTVFRYDVFGNRLEKANDYNGDGAYDETTRFSYDGWKNGHYPSPPGRGARGEGFVGNENWDVLFDLDGSSSLTTRYLRGDLIDQVFGRLTGSDGFWNLTERQGSVREVVDLNGVVKDAIGYDGFGKIISETNSNFRGRIGWTGRELDTEIDLYYFRARYYRFDVGIFTTQDPLGLAPDVNPYRYVHNSPMNATDPSGLDEEMSPMVRREEALLLGQIEERQAHHDRITRPYRDSPGGQDTIAQYERELQERLRPLQARLEQIRQNIPLANAEAALTAARARAELEFFQRPERRQGLGDEFIGNHHVGAGPAPAPPPEPEPLRPAPQLGLAPPELPAEEPWGLNQLGWTEEARAHAREQWETLRTVVDVVAIIPGPGGVLFAVIGAGMDIADGNPGGAIFALIPLGAHGAFRATRGLLGPTRVVAPQAGVRATGQGGSHFQPSASLINRANAVSETNMQHLLERVASEMNLPSDVRLIYNNVNPNSFARMGEGAYVLMEAVPARTGTGITIFVDSSVVYPQLVNAQQLAGLPLRSRIQALLAHETTEISMARFSGLELGWVSHGQAVANAPFNTLNMSQPARVYLGRWSRAGNVPAP